MRDQTAIQERYLQDALPIRLGGLAANLARIESFSDHPDHQHVVERLLEESKFFIEWTAPDADLEIKAQLAQLQIELAKWQQDWAGIWADPVQRATIAQQARAWSDKVLKLAGLLP